jgi:hypothetical protein
MICYPKRNYSQGSFLMNTIRIDEDGRAQQYMQVSMTPKNQEDAGEVTI